MGGTNGQRRWKRRLASFSICPCLLNERVQLICSYHPPILLLGYVCELNFQAGDGRVATTKGSKLGGMQADLFDAAFFFGRRLDSV